MKRLQDQLFSVKFTFLGLV